MIRCPNCGNTESFTEVFDAICFRVITIDKNGEVTYGETEVDKVEDHPKEVECNKCPWVGSEAELRG